MNRRRHLIHLAAAPLLGLAPSLRARAATGSASTPPTPPTPATPVAPALPPAPLAPPGLAATASPPSPPASPPAPPAPPQPPLRLLVGTWAVSATAERDGAPPASGGQARLALASGPSGGPQALALQLDGELGRALGGPLTLVPQGATQGPATLVGHARTGVQGTLRVRDERHLGLRLEGPGLLFELFLLR